MGVWSGIRTRECLARRRESEKASLPNEQTAGDVLDRRSARGALVLKTLGLEQHPDKTFISRIERDFDFLGYHFSPEGPTLARRTIESFPEKVSRLFEQKRQCAEDRHRVLEMHIGRWTSWTDGGVNHA